MILYKNVRATSTGNSSRRQYLEIKLFQKYQCV